MKSALLLRGAPLAGRRVTVLGLGLLGGGVEVVRALVGSGAEVTASDRRGERDLAPTLAALRGLDVRFQLGGHSVEQLARAEVVVANPAVPPSSPALAAARASGAAVTSEVELFLENTRGRVIAITGTQGKSSTAHLLAQLLEACAPRPFSKVHLGGNIGRALIGSVAAIGPDDAVVLELSSYQLEALPPDRSASHLARRVVAGCVTNVLADHLERHGSAEAYAAAKRRLLELLPAEAPLVVPREDERIAEWNLGTREVRRFTLDSGSAGSGPARSGGAREGAAGELRVERGRFLWRDVELGRVRDLKLPGRFQRANALAALGLAHALGASPEACAAALGECRGLPHRLEELGLFAGHRVFDNGVSTTPDSTAAALEALTEAGGRVTLLVGGQAKELSFAPLVEAAALRVRTALTFGASGARLARLLRAGGLEVIECADLEQAVRAAFADMPEGETLLFSPACASFDAYLNFSDRAAAFRAALPR